MKGTSGSSWVVAGHDPDVARDIARRGIPPLVARIMAARGQTAFTAAKFLSPKVGESIPDLGDFLDMDKASAMLGDAVMAGRNIGIFTDYDCDGATSAATLGRWLRMVGTEPHMFHVPDRMKEGYGPNVPALNAMFDRGCDDVFVLDSGTVATSVFAQMSPERRARIAVIDHHHANADLPDVAAVVNPNRLDNKPGHGHLCAAGVTFLLCIGASRYLKEKGFTFPNGQPNLMKLVDVVGLGTMGDVVPLTGFNRALVAQAVKLLQSDPYPPLKALMDVAAVKEIDGRMLGFALAPRLNASGRIGDARAAVDLLMSSDPADMRRRAQDLDAINIERRAVEAEAVTRAVEQVEAARADAPHARRLCLAVVDAHEGVVGIAAARLKDRFGAPSFVLTRDHEGNLKGSGRSVEGFELGDAIHHAMDEGLLVKGGGHAMAGGLTIEERNLAAFERMMNDLIAQSSYGRNGLAETFDIDAALADLDADLVRTLEKLAPFGTANPQPRVLLRDMRVMEVKAIGRDPTKRTLAVTLGDGERKIRGVAFRQPVDGNGPIETALSAGRPVHVGGRLQINEFKGNVSVEILIDDVALDPAPEPEPDETPEPR